jgi:hypothetical protein
MQNLFTPNGEILRLDFNVTSLTKQSNEILKPISPAYRKEGTIFLFRGDTLSLEPKSIFLHKSMKFSFGRIF